MPMPFHCMLCNKPVQQALNAICDECKDRKEEEE
jgi:predicted nucleic acid-binding Zn ribbon protein